MRKVQILLQQKDRIDSKHLNAVHQLNKMIISH